MIRAIAKATMQMAFFPFCVEVGALMLTSAMVMSTRFASRPALSLRPPIVWRRMVSAY
jgi:hypothetical protein